MSSRQRPLSNEEIAAAFAGKTGEECPPFLSPRQLAELLRLSPTTIYEWIARGRLDGAFRKRGKHVLIWRDRAIKIIFHSQDWRTDNEP